MVVELGHDLLASVTPCCGRNSARAVDAVGASRWCMAQEAPADARRQPAHRQRSRGAVGGKWQAAGRRTAAGQIAREEGGVGHSRHSGEAHRRAGPGAIIFAARPSHTPARPRFWVCACPRRQRRARIFPLDLVRSSKSSVVAFELGFAEEAYSTLGEGKGHVLRVRRVARYGRRGGVHVQVGGRRRPCSHSDSVRAAQTGHMTSHRR